MTVQPESRLQRRIRKHLEEIYVGSWWVKFHGGPFTPAGVPDLLGCIAGRMICLEVKQPGESPSILQVKTLERLGRAGAIVGVVTCVQDAVDLIDRSPVRRERRLPRSGGL